jgi:tetratricopeptide (TPR) repeat protein
MKPLEHPDSFHLQAAQGWLELGNDHEANEELEQITPELRSHPDVLEVRWHIYAHAKKWEVCVDLAGAIIKLVPEKPFGWIHRSFALHELKRTQEAFDLLMPVAKDFPKVWTITYNLACYCAQLGRLKECEQWFNKAMAIDEQTVRRAALVQDGQSVMTDSGTTTLALARQLPGRKALTLVTTSLPIAAALQHAPDVRVLLLGGFVRRDAADLTGALTEANLEWLRADIAFLGADGIDLSGCVYNDSPEVARLLGKMAAAARTTYIVADSSKIGRTALVRFGSIAKWGGLITDCAVSRSQAAGLRRAGVNLIVSKSTKSTKTNK